MKQFLTPHDIANTIRMMRTVENKSVLLVEGDTDSRIYNRFADPVRCTVMPAHGKSNVEIAVKILEKDKVKGILAITDSDFQRVENLKPASPHILMTDTHDLETMIIASGAFEILIAEFGAEQRIRQLDLSVRNVILNAGMPIGYLRWISSPKIDNLGLKFKNMPFINFITVGKKTLDTDITVLLNELGIRSLNGLADEKALKHKILELLKNGGHDPWQICCGHDLVHILAIGLRELFGNNSAKNISYEIIDRVLRISYTFEDFKKTALYTAMKKWEKNHTGYKIFPAQHK